MPVQVSYPGVYMDEQLSGAHAITPVSTSVTAFIGMARRGRLGTPTRVTNLTQFQTIYGSDASMGELVPQVGQFFLNGGSTAWIMRIADATAASAAVTLNNEAGQPVLRLTAADAGTDGNLTRAEVDYGTANPESTFNLTLYRRLVGPTGTVTRDVPAAAGVRQLHVTSNGGSVVIGSAQQSDVAAGLQLGVVNGGIEISRWSRARPAPTGIVARLDNAPDDLARLLAFATTNQDAIGDWRLTDPGAGAQYQATPFPAAPAQPLHVGTSFVPAAGDTALGSLLNVRQHLGTLAASIANNSSNRFAAGLQALRLAITPRFEGSDAGVDSRLTSTGAANIGTAGELFDPAAPGAYNVRAYTIGQTGGVSGAGPFQGGSAGGR